MRYVYKVNYFNARGDRARVDLKANNWDQAKKVLKARFGVTESKIGGKERVEIGKA